MAVVRKNLQHRADLASNQMSKKKAKSKLTFIDLFAGIGGIRLGLERAGAECVFTSEWDENAQKTYKTNFGVQPHGDITKISSDEIPDHDILVGGFPCQAFSIIGDMKGFEDTRGTLFFEIERIIRDKQPKAFLLENVKQLVSHDNGRTFKVIKEKLDKLGYFIHWKVLNAMDFGLPQKRERVIIIGFKENHPFQFPTFKGKKLTLADILEDDTKVDKKHFASEKVRLSVKERLKKTPPFPSIWHENKGGNISANTFSCALRANASYNYLLVNGIRRLTPRENLRLMGFPEDFKIAVLDSAIRTQCGNSVAVPVIEAVAKEFVAAMSKPPLIMNDTIPVKIHQGGQLEFA